MDRPRAGQRDLREIHHQGLGPGVQHQLGDRGPHAAGPTDDQGTLAVVAKRVEQSHGFSLSVVGTLCPPSRGDLDGRDTRAGPTAQHRLDHVHEGFDLHQGAGQQRPVGPYREQLGQQALIPTRREL